MPESDKTDESKSEITPATRFLQQQLEEDIKQIIHKAHLAWNAPKTIIIKKKKDINAQNS